MTSPNIDAPQPKAESFLDWFRIKTPFIVGGALIVVAAGFGYWFVGKSAQLKRERAEKQLTAAQQAYQTGNVPLAEADLKKVADQYSNTPAGAEAGILLAQLKLEQDKPLEAVTSLRALGDKVDDGPYAATIRALLGDSYAQAGKPAEAAAEYDRASQLTTMPNERASYLAKMGRAYQAAGKHAEARKTWESLATQQESPVIAAEARMRLGELLATPSRS